MPAPPPLRKLKCPSVAAARKELKRSATGCSLSFPDIGLLEDSKDENGRKDGRKVWEGLVDLLAENLQHLQALNVSKNGLRPTIVYKLTSALAQNRFLHNLNLSGSNIGGGGLALLVKGLEKSTTLCKLNLYNNAIGDEHTEVFAEYLGSEGCQLEEVNLSNNVLGPASGKWLAGAVGTNSTLRVLKLWMNAIGDEGAVYFAEALRTNSTLLVLNLFFNLVEEEGGVALAQALQREGSCLEELDLGRNEVGPKGGMELAVMLRSSRTLKKLDLMGNHIKDEAAAAILEAVALNTGMRLSKLILTDNALTEAMGDPVADALTACHIDFLNLSKNNLGHGLRTVAEALLEARENLTVGGLALTGNKAKVPPIELAETGAILVQALLSPDAKLSALDLRDNKMGEACEVLAEHLPRRPVAQTEQAVASQTDEDKAQAAEAAQAKADGIVFRLIFGDGLEPLKRGRHLRDGGGDEDDDDDDDSGDDDSDGGGTEPEPELAGEAEGGTERWSRAAFKLAASNIFLFVQCMRRIDEVYREHREQSSDLPAWSVNADLWTQKDPRKGKSGMPMLHHIFAGNQGGGLSQMVRFLRAKMKKSEVMIELFDSKDARKRTLRSLALATGEPEVKEWASAYGTFLNRYRLDDRPPVHVSRTCCVFFAVDVAAASASASASALASASVAEGGKAKAGKESKRSKKAKKALKAKEAREAKLAKEAKGEEEERKVALKIMKHDDDFDRELASRGVVLSEAQRLLEAVPLEALGQQTEFEHTMPLLAVHPAQNCIVMPQADRSLFEAINTERLAVHDIQRIQRVALDLAKAVEEFREHELVHGDIKPRNVLRASQTSSAHYFEQDPTSGSQGFDLDVWRDKVDEEDDDDDDEGGEGEGGELSDVPEEDDEHGDDEDEDGRTGRRKSKSKMKKQKSKAALAKEKEKEKEKEKAKAKEKEKERMKKKKTGNEQHVDEKWLLIDLDATVKFPGPMTSKRSTGYMPPETAKHLFGGGGGANGSGGSSSSSSGGGGGGGGDNEEGGGAVHLASTAYDVWSFGAVLYELLSGTSLFLMEKTTDDLVSAEDKAELTNWLVLDEARLQRIQGSGARFTSARDLVQRCLVGDPDDRISLDELLAHSFVRDAPPHKPKPQRSDVFAVANTIALGKGKGKDKDSRKSKSKSKRFSTKPNNPFVRKMVMLARARALKSAEKEQAEAKALAKALAKASAGAAGVEAEARSRSGSMAWGAEPEKIEHKLETHFFLSHAQKEAAGVVKDIYLNVHNKRCTAWLDVLASDLTLPGMKRGIEKAGTFIFALSTWSLFRPFCLIELDHAIKGGKRVIFVVQTDARFYAWSRAHVPWLGSDELGPVTVCGAGTDGARADDGARAEIFRDLYEKERDWSVGAEGAVDQGPAQEKAQKQARQLLEEVKFFELGMGQLRDGLPNFDTIVANVSQYFEKNFEDNHLIYRSRLYETDAMVNRILQISDITAPEAIKIFDEEDQRERAAKRAAERASELANRGRTSVGRGAVLQSRSSRSFRSARSARSGGSTVVARTKRLELVIVCAASGPSRDKAAAFRRSVVAESEKKHAFKGTVFDFDSVVLDEGGERLNRLAHPDHDELSRNVVVLVMLADGLFKGTLAADLFRFWTQGSGETPAGAPRTNGKVVALQVEREWTWTEHKQLEESGNQEERRLFNALFRNTEILYYRDADDYRDDVRRTRGYDHEHRAMLHKVKDTLAKRFVPRF